MNNADLNLPIKELFNLDLVRSIRSQTIVEFKIRNAAEMPFKQRLYVARWLLKEAFRFLRRGRHPANNYDVALHIPRAQLQWTEKALDALWREKCKYYEQKQKNRTRE